METASVLVIGGGPAGIACAISLKRQAVAIDVILLEGKDRSAFRPGEHLSSAARSAVVDLGMCEATMSALSKECWEIRSCWGGPQDYANESIFDAHGPGLVLSRPAFDSALTDVAQNCGVSVAYHARPISVRKLGGKWKVNALVGGQSKTIYCDLVVDASGRNAPFAQTFGASAVRYDKLVGLTAFAAISNKPYCQDYILVEAVENGWWYSATQKGRLITTFMTDGDLINRQGRQLKDIWMDCLRRAPKTCARLGKLTLCSDILSRTAHTQCLYPASGDGWLAIGDAASSFDPLSSQGIIKGLQDGKAAASAIHETLCGQDSRLRQFTNTLHARFHAYLKMRRGFYALENRWSNHKFWERRQVTSWPERNLWLDPEQRIDIACRS